MIEIGRLLATLDLDDDMKVPGQVDLPAPCAKPSLTLP